MNCEGVFMPLTSSSGWLALESLGLPNLFLCMYKTFVDSRTACQSQYWY